MANYVFLVTSTGSQLGGNRQVIASTRGALERAIEDSGGKLESFVAAGPYDEVEVLETRGDDVALNILQFDNQTKAYTRAGYVYLGGKLVTPNPSKVIGRKKARRAARSSKAGPKRGPS